MEQMPQQAESEPQVATVATKTTKSMVATAPGWRAGLPVLSNDVVTLRDLRLSDATSLFSMLSTDEVRRFVSSPPIDVPGYERFIKWAHAERIAGRCFCYAVVPAGSDVAIGILQVRSLETDFRAAEWGAAIGSPFWGTGLFVSGARLLLDFLFDDVQVHRLEGRAAVQNGRANGAVRKLGAVPEGVLRRGLWCRGQYFDQLMWSILAEDWRELRRVHRPVVH